MLHHRGTENAEAAQRTAPKYRFVVTLPIEVDGQVYQFGQVVELEMEQAIEYAHALIAVEEPVVRLGGIGSERETE